MYADVHLHITKSVLAKQVLMGGRGVVNSRKTARMHKSPTPDEILTFAGDVCITRCRIHSDPCPFAYFRLLCDILDLHCHCWYQKDSLHSGGTTSNFPCITTLPIHSSLPSRRHYRVHSLGTCHFEFPFWKLFDGEWVSECFVCVCVCGECQVGSSNVDVHVHFVWYECMMWQVYVFESF